MYAAQTTRAQLGMLSRELLPAGEGEDWRAHVRAHHVTGRKYAPQMVQMQRNLQALGVEAGVVAELARM